MKRSPQARFDSRSGYTLMEVLIASVLIATLMAACWNLMSLYSGFLSAGREKVLEQQLARSIFQLIGDDIGLVSLPNRPGPTPPLPAVLPPNAESDLQLPEPLAAAFTTPTLEAVDFKADPTIEVVGTSSSLQITFLGEPPAATTVADPFAGTEMELDIAPLTTAGEARTVLYHFEAPEPGVEVLAEGLEFGLHRVEVSAFQLQEAKENQRLGLLEGAAQPGSSGGFSKLTYDAIFEPTDNLTEALATATGPTFEPTHEHAPEVMRCGFEFHDTNRWVSNWNSRQRSALPYAIRVTLWLASSAEVETVRDVVGAGSLPQGDSDALPGIRPRRYQRIIALSAAAKPEADLLGADR